MRSASEVVAMRRVASGAALFLSAVSLFCFVQEWRGIVAVNEGLTERASDLNNEVSHRGFSMRIRRDAIAPCLEQSSAIVLRLLPEDRRRSLAHGCLVAADAGSGWGSSIAEEALAKAVSYDVIGDTDAMQAALSKTHALAPRVGWLVQRRLDLTVQHFDTLSGEELESFREDLRVMANERAYVPLLVERMKVWSDPAKEEILAAVETVPGSLQRRFLREMEQGSP